jgi:hypothetical protein
MSSISRILKRIGESDLWRTIYLIPVYIYRNTFLPFIKPRCIYYPSCSEYFVQAVEKYGVFRGTLKGTYRVLRCNPFAKGGYDPLT